MLYVVDTHVLIWYFTGSKHLRKELKEKIDTLRHQGGGLLVRIITATARFYHAGVLTKDKVISESGEVILF